MSLTDKIQYVCLTDTCARSVPKKTGAYVIIRTLDKITAESYVGSTKNLYNRMCCHKNKEMIRIDLFITNDMMLVSLSPNP